MRYKLLLIVFFGTFPLSTQLASAAPLAEEYLRTGQLSEGATALQAHLKKSAADDEARFGLGVIQFFQSFEHLGTNFYNYGLLTRSGFGNLPGRVSDFLPANPSPKTLSYTDFRQILQTWVNDLNAAEKTLSAIKDPDVKLPLPVMSIKVNLFGNGTLVDGSYLMGTVRTPEEQKLDSKFVIQFDRGDADWLAGYCNFLCAWGEVLLAIDGQEMFNCTAHLFFEKVETPYPFLVEGNRNFNSILGGPRGFNRPLISDILAFIHLWRFELKEPERMKTALAHLEDMQRHAKSMWKYYLAETDNENEWIPNPNQTGVLEIKVTQEMVDTWLVVVDEAGEVLQGKKLIPFWRGKPGTQGVNLRRVFTEPRKIDPFLWVQGTAAAPYLEKGTITDFASPEMWGRINRTFGRNNFFTLAFWFN
ncbi:hypothetical protein [Gimesia maris]|uniref:Tetratricopeptide repeat protein n=1 Tax=Gimesia maris TaxID=122 RepID=A0ABX5YTR8_9PLAN|nr:hypothetical protein [Gimesia maris]EDL56559.1 hypothetical protein PM8797T_10479 [Gimesia maris DSM 8797]QEG19071.1 hypothetical protein GmarT_49680 [Gimesia maris]QGQ28039.1 hypothetical protein F1729_04870 [Gimesia maris]